jgi:hypothetical protein
MQLSSQHEQILFLLLLIVAGVIIYRACKITDQFANQEQIAEEVNKQLNLIQQINTHQPDSQSAQQFPHLEVIKNYENRASSMLTPLKTLSESRKKQLGGELDQLDKVVKSLTKYVKDDITEQVTAKPVNVIKSWNNGLELGVRRLDKSSSTYMIGMNGGCLNVTPENAASVQPCNQADPNQIFNLNHVFNEVGYRSQLDPLYPRLSEIKDVKYPFGLLKARSNGNCVKNFHGQVSVEPCREYDGQRWAGLVSSQPPTARCNRA